MTHRPLTRLRSAVLSTARGEADCFIRLKYYDFCNFCFPGFCLCKDDTGDIQQEAMAFRLRWNDGAQAYPKPTHPACRAGRSLPWMGLGEERRLLHAVEILHRKANAVIEYEFSEDARDMMRERNIQAAWVKLAIESPERQELKDDGPFRSMKDDSYVLWSVRMSGRGE